MKRHLAAIAIGASIVTALPARADGPLAGRASTEVAAYSDTNHVAVLTPSAAAHVDRPTSGWSIDGSYLVDVVSAASPDIVSTASRRWTEVRQAGDLRAAYKPGNVGASIEGSASSEPDYLSLAAGGTVTLDLDDRNVTLLAGYGFGHDTIGRTGTPFAVFSHPLARHAITGSASFVIDKATVLALVADASIERGDPSKPYRYIPLFAADVAPRVPVGATLDVVTRLREPGSALEQLPRARDRLAITARLAHRFARSTVRLEARVYDDSWGLGALTSDARWLVDATPRVSLGPHARYHVQSAASFWRLAYVGNASDVPALRTGDRELGPLMNLTLGGSARWAIGPRGRTDAWALGFHVDATYSRYFADLYVTRALSSLEAITLEASW